MTITKGVRTAGSLVLNPFPNDGDRVVRENSRGKEYKEFEVCPEEYSYSEESPSIEYGYCTGHDTLLEEDFGEYEFPKPCTKEEMESRKVSNLPEPETREQSIFVHSSPSQFPDIHNVNSSVFRSIFVRTSTRSGRDSLLKKKIMESQCNIFSQLGNVSGSEISGTEEKFDIRNSVFKDYENGGATKDEAFISSSQCEIYPIAESVLFTIRLRDCVHQTKRPSKIEERITNGTVRHLKLPYNWPSGSVWTGHWDGLGMAGAGSLIMPHEVTYVGKMINGMCHDDDATLIYPNGFKALHCNYIQGELLDCQFQFPDLLIHEKQNWSYCRYPDRRFWSEIQNSLRAAKVTQKTQLDPPKNIPMDFYDTNDGLYNPKTRMLVNQTGELLRVPTAEEAEWIKQKCRKGFHQYTGFCPELFENWFCNDLEMLKSLAEMQKRYLKGEITYKELYHFYTNNKLLPTWPSFKNVKALSDFEMEKGKDICPSPKKLVHRLEKRYEGHRIPLDEKTEKSIDNCKKFMKQHLLKRATAVENLSTEKLSVKVKFEKSRKTPVLNTAKFSIDEKDSRSILKGARTNLETEMSKKKLDIVPSYPSHENSSEAFSIFESDVSGYERKLLMASMEEIIMDIVQDIVLQEREKHRNRFVWAQPLNNIEFGPRNEKEKCIQVLEELYNSIPRKSEYCDSVPHNDCDLKNLAKDKFQMLKYWGNRIFTLGFDEGFYNE